MYRLGNYTILEDDKNRMCETLPFDQKKAIYKTSQYQMTKEIDYAAWTPNAVERRQENLAQQATSVWRISQYD